jgi:hypothetical protein
MVDNQEQKAGYEKVDVIGRKTHCNLAAQAGKLFDKCCGMSDCDRIMFFEFLQVYGDASPEEREQMLNQMCHSVNQMCHSVNQMCHSVNQMCVSVNIFGPDHVSTGVMKIMKEHGSSLCELVKVMEQKQILDEIEALPESDQKLLQNMVDKKKLVIPLQRKQPVEKADIPAPK